MTDDTAALRVQVARQVWHWRAATVARNSDSAAAFPPVCAWTSGAGAMMWANIFSPKTITGAPISWILNGNPVLEGVWLGDTIDSGGPMDTAACTYVFR